LHSLTPNHTVRSSPFEDQDEIDEARAGAPLNNGKPTALADPSANSKLEVSRFFCVGPVSPTKPDQRMLQAPRKSKRKYVWNRFKLVIVRPASSRDLVDVVIDASR
jgi:hypothetical protein